MRRAAALADHAEAVGIVGHQPGVVFARERRQFRERRQVAVHRENTVGDDEDATMLVTFVTQEPLGIGEIVMREGRHAGAAQPCAGPEAGMGQRVEQHQIALAHQRRDDPGIGEIAGAEDAGRRRTLQPRQPLLQFAQQRMIAGDEAGGAGARAILFDSRGGRRFHRRVMSEIEIVVA